MSKLETRIQLKRDTTENWNNAQGFIPKLGEIIIYTDYETITEEIAGKTIELDVPNIKIGTGNGYVQDLPFVDEKLRNNLMLHIENMDMHTTLNEKLFWNNKVNIDDNFEQIYQDVEEETLVFTRN